jgi:hypothetical protein
MESRASPVAGPCSATRSLENGLNHHGALLLGTAPSQCGHAVSPKSWEHTGRGHGRMREALSAFFAPEGLFGALSRSAGAVHLSTMQTKERDRMKIDLSGKTAIVIGSTGGIGPTRPMSF